MSDIRPHPVSDIATRSPFAPDVKARLAATEEAAADYLSVQEPIKRILQRSRALPGESTLGDIGIYEIVSSVTDADQAIQFRYGLVHISGADFGELSGIAATLRTGPPALKLNAIGVGTQGLVWVRNPGGETPQYAFLALDPLQLAECEEPPGIARISAGGGGDPRMWDFVLAQVARTRWLSFNVTGDAIAAQFGGGTTGTLALFTLKPNEIIEEYAVSGPGYTIGMGVTVTVTIGHAGDGGTFATDVDWWVASHSLIDATAFTGGSVYSTVATPLLRTGAHTTTAIVVNAYYTSSGDLANLSGTGSVTYRFKVVQL